METVFHKQFREDLAYWVKQDRKVALRIFKLIEATSRDLYTGIGKPEHLKYIDQSLWSRRITQEHRLVYNIIDKRVHFLQARYHY